MTEWKFVCLAMDGTFPKWTKDQIALLIEAYKKEVCLYSARCPNYHNKRIRGAAISRVCDIVRTLRPMATDKECLGKFHNLRNQFNVENSKRRASIIAGCEGSDVYIPSLWYFDSLLFLDDHYKPRKSMRIANGDMSFLTPEGPKVEYDTTYDSDAHLAEYAEIQGHDDAGDEYCDPLIAEGSGSALTSNPGQASSPASFSEFNGGSSKQTLQGRVKRKRTSTGPGDDEHDKDISLNSRDRPFEKSNQFIESALGFAADALRGLKSNKLRMESLHKILNVVMDAQRADLENPEE